MTRPLRVFLCHASQDKPAVRKLYRYLKQHGIQPWLDEIDLLPGENWEVEIPNAIDNSDVILVCLSKNSINKEGYVQKEISFALDKALEKPDGTIFIIPAKLEDCEVPKRLNRYQWVDLFRPDSNKRLLLGLNKRAIELGSDVSPVILEDTRQRNSTPKPLKLVAPNQAELEKLELEEKEKNVRKQLELEAKEKGNREAIEIAAREKLAWEAKENATREKLELEVQEKAKRKEPVQKKPFTKLLDPSSLLPQEKSRPKTDSQSVKKPIPRFNPRLLSIGSVILLALIFGGFGLNYLINHPPVTPTLQLVTAPPINPAAGSTWNQTVDGMILLFVPASTFTMGSNVSDQVDEKPEHQVILDAFWIDKTEVTNKMYAKCVDANKCDPPKEIKSHTRLSYFRDPEFDSYPVVYVNWNMAKAYCEWAGRKLPTEAQWEKAARSTVARTYPWDDAAPTDLLLNYANNVGDTTKVGSYPEGASIYGALDMAGNVWEWVNDWYDENYYRSSSLSNPLGPSSGQYRVLRGGSWDTTKNFIRTSKRYRYVSSNSDNTAGFRCAFSP